jgi:hypothetical protein
MDGWILAYLHACVCACVCLYMCVCVRACVRVLLVCLFASCSVGWSSCRLRIYVSAPYLHDRRGFVEGGWKWGRNIACRSLVEE